MIGVLQLRGGGLKYRRPLETPLISHYQNPYSPDIFSNFQQVLIRPAGY